MGFASTTALGNFLFQLRRSRGYSSVNEYLRKYYLPISHVHYRHLEAGSRKISIESAKVLCDGLQACPKEFYYHFLKDWLPSELMDCFVSLSGGQHDFDDAKVAKRKSATPMKDKYVHFPDEECCDYLYEHFDLMPIVWFIYTVPKTNLDEIALIAKRNNISVSIEQVLDDFERYGLIRRESVGAFVQRIKPGISFRHHKLGSKIVQHEADLSLALYVDRKNPKLKEMMITSGLVALSPRSRQILYRRIHDIARNVKEASRENVEFSNEQVEPMFYSIVFAPRPQYAPVVRSK